MTRAREKHLARLARLAAGQSALDYVPRDRDVLVVGQAPGSLCFSHPWLAKFRPRGGLAHTWIQNLRRARRGGRALDGARKSIPDTNSP